MRNQRTLPVEDAVGEYFRTMVTTSGSIDLFRFLYDRGIRNLRRIESILNGERDPGQMPTLYKKTADILNYLVLLYQEQMGEDELLEVHEFIQLHHDLLQSMVDFAWDMDAERVVFCKEILTHIRRQLGQPQIRIPRHEAMLQAPEVVIPQPSAPSTPPRVAGVRSAALAAERMEEQGRGRAPYPA